MIRTLLWLIGGLLLGGIIHIATILALPLLAEETAWSRVSTFEAKNRMVVLDAMTQGAPNPLHLDPELSYGLCQIDLSDGPAYLNGVLPDAFWSVAVYDQNGIVIYSTTNRDGIGQTVDMGVFNPAQTRLLAQQEIDITEGLLIVEAASNDLFVLVRLSAPHAAMRARFEAELSEISCGPRA
ncbi:DUF1254 domain-containing protein [Devosia sp. XK-2]|uniref:DUF1254 domain-containing protein n=1 Tax=Devosia sp. XK-2 TaxID=3126689 RepID=UPI0030D34F3C